MYDKALLYYEQALEIQEKKVKLKRGIGFNLGNIGCLFSQMGKYNEAIKYLNRSIKIFEKLGEDKGATANYLRHLGNVHFERNELDKAVYYFKKTEPLESQTFHDVATTNKIYLYLAYKQIGKEYDKKEIQTLIKKIEKPFFKFDTYFRIYQLLEDSSYLETAYNQIQELADNLEPDIKAKFINFPIPKTIIEEYIKVFKK